MVALPSPVAVSSPDQCHVARTCHSLFLPRVTINVRHLLQQRLVVVTVPGLVQFVLFVKGFIEIFQNRDPPGNGVLRGREFCVHRWKVPVFLLEHHERHTDLPEIVHRGGIEGPPFGLSEIKVGVECAEEVRLGLLERDADARLGTRRLADRRPVQGIDQHSDGVGVDSSATIAGGT